MRVEQVPEATVDDPAAPPPPVTPDRGSATPAGPSAAPAAPAPGTPRRRGAGVREVALLALVYVAYSAGRLLADHHLAPAVASAHRLLGIERFLGVDVEAAAGHALLRAPWLSTAASYWYAGAHYVVTATVLALLYRRAPDRYRPLRRALVAATAVALVLYVLMPTAPPRLVGAPYVDVLAATADHGWWGADASAPRGLGGLTNELAAFPSMHAGWALWVAVVALAVPCRRWARVLAGAYALGTALVVVTTGNHWVVDVVAGWAVMAAACGGAPRPPPGAPGAPGAPVAPEDPGALAGTGGPERA